MELYEREKVIEEFVELVTTFSASRNERKIGDLLLEKLQEIGCVDLYEDNAGQMIEATQVIFMAFCRGLCQDPFYFALIWTVGSCCLNGMVQYQKFALKSVKAGFTATEPLYWRQMMWQVLCPF